MEQAAFSLKGYKFDKVELNFDDLENGDFKLDIEPSGVFVEKDKSYELTFVFKAIAVDDKSLNETPVVKIRCVAVFDFKNVNSFKDIPQYFYSNSIAILFPYIRAFVSTVTLQANIPPMIIPTMNLSSLKAELEKNTKVQ